MKLKHTLYYMAFAILLAGCRNFEYHPYAADVYGRTGISQQSIDEIERICAGRDTIRFAFITDTQGAYDELKDAVEWLASRPDVQFIVHGGDQSDFGLTKEFLWTRDILDRQPRPYLCLLGNHDCLGTGEHTYEVVYGKQNFSLNAAFLHIVGLNTVALEYDYSHPVPDFRFMEDDFTQAQALADSITNTVVVMHAPPHDEQFNDNVANVFEHYVTQYPGLGASDGHFPADYPDTLLAATRRRGFCANGHCHRDDIRQVFGDGVLYYGLTNAADRELLIFTMTRQGYECEKISF